MVTYSFRVSDNLGNCLQASLMNLASQKLKSVFVIFILVGSVDSPRQLGMLNLLNYSCICNNV